MDMINEIYYMYGNDENLGYVLTVFQFGDEDMDFPSQGDISWEIFISLCWLEL
jgi:hypothetical protein